MKRLTVNLLLLLLFIVPACKEEVKIYRVGAVLPLSGPSAAYGQNVKNGLMLAMEEINKAGGIHGKQIDLLIEDDQSTDTTAVLKTTQLINNSKVPVIIGGVTSTTALAMAPVCQASKVVMLSPTASSPKLSHSGEYIFRNYPSDTLEGIVMAEYAVRQMRVASVAILSVDNEYGRGVTGVFKERFSALRGAIVYEQFYPDGTVDFAGQVKEIKEQDPDAVYLPGYYTEIAAILKEIRAQDVEAKLMSVEGVAQPMILEIAAEAAEGLVYPQPPYDAESDDPEIRRFVAAYRAKFPSDPDVDAAFGFDALHVIARAIEKSTNYPEDLRIHVADTSLKGITGDIAFDSNGDVNITPLMFQAKGGKFVQLR